MANILIVEDEKAISDLIVLNLKLAGHVCRQAFDGEEAAAEMERWQAARKGRVFPDGAESFRRKAGDFSYCQRFHRR